MLSDSQFRDLVSGRWKGPLATILRGGLWLLARPYGWIVRRRNARFDLSENKTTRVPALVISVGNITVGGTGKSPFVAWLARWYLDRKNAVTIISRGYGSRGGKPNDEALELAARLPGVPHLQNPDRIVAANEALATNPAQILILDDAFQHRRLARDLDIVLLDALEPFGHGHLLPRGLLREPIENLARAEVVALSRSDAVSADRRREIEALVYEVAPRALWLELIHKPTRLVSASGDSLDLVELRGQRVAAFCGIGNPAGFRSTLESCGFEVAGWLELPDHCAYEGQTMAGVTKWLESLNVQHVFCTRKDLVKIPQTTIAGKRLWALDVELEIVRGQSELETLLQPLIHQLPVAVVVGPLAAVIDVDLVDDFHALDLGLEQLLGELLVIKRIDAAAEHDAVRLLLDLQSAEVENAAAFENRLGLQGNVCEKCVGHPSLPSLHVASRTKMSRAASNSLALNSMSLRAVLLGVAGPRIPRRKLRHQPM